MKPIERIADRGSTPAAVLPVNGDNTFMNLPDPSTKRIAYAAFQTMVVCAAPTAIM
ncbi:MAG: hypothetical protein AAF702_23520 [Chloroflexota bacterium]